MAIGVGTSHGRRSVRYRRTLHLACHRCGDGRDGLALSGTLEGSPGETGWLSKTKKEHLSPPAPTQHTENAHNKRRMEKSFLDIPLHRRSHSIEDPTSIEGEQEVFLAVAPRLKLYLWGLSSSKMSETPWPTTASTSANSSPPCFQNFLAQYGDEDLASVATATMINALLSAEDTTGA